MVVAGTREPLTATSPYRTGKYASAGLLVLVRGEGAERSVLGVRRSISGCFGLPGGKLATTESTSQAALRELQEETGATITQLPMRWILSRKFGRRQVDYYLADGNKVYVDLTNGDDVKWLTIGAYLAQTPFEDDREVFQKAGLIIDA